MKINLSSLLTKCLVSYFVDNFIFSDNLEISILEHRFTILLEMLEKVNVNYFFPSVIYNESFWQTPYEKRLAILSSNQVEWFGQSPVQRSVFYRDVYFLELVKSIKLTYFSYTKINLDSLLDILTTKNRFSVTEFSQFGDAKNSPIAFLNGLFYKNIFSSTSDDELFSQNYGKLPKISAVKFYKRFVHKKKIKALVFDFQNCFGYWEDFFSSLKIIDAKQKTNVLEKLSFYFTSTYQEVIDKFLSQIQKFPTLNSLYKDQIIKFEIIDTADLDLNDKFDYIFSYFGLNELPTEAFLKYGNKLFNANGRICYTKRENEKEALEKIAEIQSPLSSYKSIKKEDLQDLDYEIIWKEFDNQKVIELIEQNYSVREKSYFRFSVPVLTFFIKTIKSLSKDGYIELWNLGEMPSTQGTLGIQRTENGNVSSIIDLRTYLDILTSFEDISINYDLNNFQTFLSKEILKSDGAVVPLDQLIFLATQDRRAWEKLFNIKNFTWEKEVAKIEKSFSFYSFLKRKKILLLGLPTFLYNIGFKKFRSKILENKKLSSFFEENSLKNNGFNAYSRDFLIAATAKLISSVFNKKSMICIVNDKESSQNKEFYEIIESAGLDKDKVMTTINSMWSDLLTSANHNTNIEVLEIIKN